MQKLSEVLEKTLDIDGILELAGEAPELAAPETEMLIQKDTAFGYRTEEKVRIGVADDEAFCFFYADNLNLLEQMGAELVRFSPIHDRELPENLDGLLLSGGYPELNGEALEENQEMCTRIREIIRQGMPVSGRMRRFHVLVRIDGGYGWKCVSYGTGCSGKGLPDTEAEPVRLYHPYAKTRIPGLGEIRCAAMSFITLTPQIAEVHFMRQNRHLKEDWDCIHDKTDDGRISASLLLWKSAVLALEFLEQCVWNIRKNRRKQDDKSIASSCTGHRICAGSSDRRSQMACIIRSV